MLGDGEQLFRGPLTHPELDGEIRRRLVQWARSNKRLLMSQANIDVDSKTDQELGDMLMSIGMRYPTPVGQSAATVVSPVEIAFMVIANDVYREHGFDPPYPGADQTLPGSGLGSPWLILAGIAALAWIFLSGGSREQG